MMFFGLFLTTNYTNFHKLEPQNITLIEDINSNDNKYSSSTNQKKIIESVAKASSK